MAELSQNFLKDNLTNPQKAFLWDVVLPTVIGGGDTDVLQARAQTAELPGRSVGTFNIPYKQTAGVQYAGKLQFDHNWSVTFVEGEDGLVYQALYNWAQAVIDAKTGVSTGDDKIKTNLYFNLVSTKNEDVRQVKLIGCFLQELPKISVSYEDQNAIKVSAVFSYDSWELVK